MTASLSVDLGRDWVGQVSHIGGKSQSAVCEPDLVTYKKKKMSAVCAFQGTKQTIKAFLKQRTFKPNQVLETCVFGLTRRVPFRVQGYGLGKPLALFP